MDFECGRSRSAGHQDDESVGGLQGEALIDEFGRAPGDRPAWAWREALAGGAEGPAGEPVKGLAQEKEAKRGNRMGGHGPSGAEGEGDRKGAERASDGAKGVHGAKSGADGRACQCGVDVSAKATDKAMGVRGAG